MNSEMSSEMRKNSKHLSKEEISSWLLGDRPVLSDLHLQECKICRADVERLSLALGGFRSSMRDWSEKRNRNQGWAAEPPRRVSSIAPGRLGWGLAAAGACLAMVLSLGGLRFGPEVGQQERPAVSDTMLLQQIDSELSREVPGPMEPLAKLMSTEGTAQ